MSHQYIIAAVVVLVLIAIYVVVTMRKRDSDLAACGWTVSLLKGCGHCERQKLLLDVGGFKQVTEYAQGGAIISSYTTPPPVPYSSIKAFPFWYNTKTKVGMSGYQDASALKAMAKC